MFLATHFLIDLEEELAARCAGPARAYLGRNRSVRYAVSVISLGELAAGMQDTTAARQFLARFRIVPLKPEIALSAAAIDRVLMQSGERLGENDNWIAGFALYYGVALVSSDRAFDRVAGLRRIPY